MRKRENWPLVSCITTTYQKFKYLYDTLDSIFTQNYPNIELIIGDDGSSDFPEAVIWDYIQTHKGTNITNVIVHHNERNEGTVSNCANCRNLANGTYIMGIASDDRFHDPFVISDVVEFFEHTGAQVVTCIRQFVDEQTDKEITCMPTKKQRKWLEDLPPEKLFQKMASFPFVSGSSTYYTKDFYNRMGQYDRSFLYIEDVPFYLKILRRKEKIFFFPRRTILYRYGNGLSTTPNTSNIFRQVMYDDRLHYMEKEILPYMQGMPWWRREQMKVRVRRFELDRENKNLYEIYLRLFFYSPIGTLVHMHYQNDYQKHLKKKG